MTDGAEARASAAAASAVVVVEKCMVESWSLGAVGGVGGEGATRLSDDDRRGAKGRHSRDGDGEGRRVVRLRGL